MHFGFALLLHIKKYNKQKKINKQPKQPKKNLFFYMFGEGVDEQKKIRVFVIFVNSFILLYTSVVNFAKNFQRKMLSINYIFT